MSPGPTFQRANAIKALDWQAVAALSLACAVAFCGIAPRASGAIGDPLPEPVLEVLAEFGGPSSELTSDDSGFLWGVTDPSFEDGDIVTYGSVFKMDPRTREVVTVLTFTGNGGAAPGVINDPIRLTYVPSAAGPGKGELWGVGYSTFDSDLGEGTGSLVFSVNAATGAYTRITSYTGDTGAFPFSNPAQPLLFVQTSGAPAGSGFIWGTTLNGGADDLGVLFRISSTGNHDVTKVAEFTAATGHVAGALAADAKGTVWGGTIEGGDFGNVSLLFTATVNAAGIKKVHDFSEDEQADGVNATSLTFVPEGANGALWGLTSSALFKIDATTKALVVIDDTLSNSDGAPLVLAGDPAGLDGITLWGLTLDGSASQLFKVLGDVVVPVSDLATPADPVGLIPAADGNFYTVVNDTDPATFDPLAEINLIRSGPSPVTLPADVAGKDATLHATVNPNGLPTTAHFEYGRDALLADATATPDVILGAGTDPVDLDLLLTSLTASTGYFYRVVASNVANTHPQNGAIESFANAFPEITTGAANISATGDVTLNGTVNPHGIPAEVYFEYGLGTDYGSTTAKTPIGGTAPIPFTAIASGLEPRSQYHFRAVAANASFTVNGEDGTFTLSNQAPTARNVTLTTAGAPNSIDLTTLASDPDGDDLTFTVTQGTVGAASIADGMIVYTPAASFGTAGTDSLTYTVVDGFGGSATGTIKIVSRPELTTVAFAGRTTGSPLPGAGTGDIPANAVARRFGPPAMNRNGEVAYRVNFTSTALPSGQAIVGPASAGQAVIAITGSDLGAAGLPGLEFSNFRNPVLGGADAGDFGRVAIIATLRGAGVTPENNVALFTNNTADGSLTLVARKGFPPSEDSSVTAAAFISIVMDGGSNVFYTAKLKAPAGRDFALLDSSGFLLRTGDTVTAPDGIDRQVATIAALAEARGSPGAVRGYSQGAGGRVLARVGLTSGGSAIVQLDSGSADVLAASGETPGLPGTQNVLYAGFGLPAGPLDPTYAAVFSRIAIVNPTTNSRPKDNAIIADGTLALRGGDRIAPKLKLRTCTDPVGGEGSGFAMIANKRALVWLPADRVIRVVARTGAESGLPGASLKSITSVALPAAPNDGPSFGPIFEGTVKADGSSFERR